MSRLIGLFSLSFSPFVHVVRGSQLVAAYHAATVPSQDTKTCCIIVDTIDVIFHYKAMLTVNSSFGHLGACTRCPVSKIPCAKRVAVQSQQARQAQQAQQDAQEHREHRKHRKRSAEEQGNHRTHGTHRAQHSPSIKRLN